MDEMECVCGKCKKITVMSTGFCQHCGADLYEGMPYARKKKKVQAGSGCGESND
jgi:rRNA maturation endonuclease Nob1